MLRLSSVQHEYYLGGLPGIIQYKKTKEELISLNIEISNADESGYVLCEHSKENLNRLTPHTQRGKLGKILLVMKCEKDDELWLNLYSIVYKGC